MVLDDNNNEENETGETPTVVSDNEVVEVSSTPTAKAKSKSKRNTANDKRDDIISKVIIATMIKHLGGKFCKIKQK